MLLLSDLNQAVGIAIIGYVIVFFALVLLYYIFTYLAKGLLWKKKRQLIKENKAHKIEDEQLIVPGEVATAIAMSLYLSRILHDEESDILTIKRVDKTYTPWSSKIYGMRNYRR